MPNSQSIGTFTALCRSHSSVEKGFWQQWQEYHDYLYHCCIKWMGGNPTDAEDALSRAMLKAWEKVQQFAGKITNFKEWLRKLTHNLCVDIHRERSRGANRVENIEAIPEQQGLVRSEGTPERALDADEKRIAIRRTIDNLPPRLRETFILHFYEELSYQEIAQQQEISYQNVCKRISQARAILREELRGYFIGEEGKETELLVTPTLEVTESANGDKSQGNGGIEPITGEKETSFVAVEEAESVVGELLQEVEQSVKHSESSSVAATCEEKLEENRDGYRYIDAPLCERQPAATSAWTQFERRRNVLKQTPAQELALTDEDFTAPLQIMLILLSKVFWKSACNSKNSEISFGERLINVNIITLQYMTPTPSGVPEAPFQDAAKENITDIPDIYPSPGWVWQYPPPKQLILRFAQPLVLTAVELFHYAIILTQLGVAYALYRFPPQASYESLFWLMMAPVFQSLAGFAPVLMHEYEGWQIAPFQDPPSEQGDPPLNRGKYNNERLREAAYKLLFAYQTVAAIMFIIGVYGVQQWKLGFLTISHPWTLIILGLTFVWLYICPRTPLSTFNVDFGQGKRPVLPIPIGILVTFAIATLIYIIAMIHVYGLVPALITTVFLVLGGVIEGLVAESTFNQFWHWLAVACLGAAGITQIIALVYL